MLLTIHSTNAANDWTDKNYYTGPSKAPGLHIGTLLSVCFSSPEAFSLPLGLLTSSSNVEQLDALKRRARAPFTRTDQLFQDLLYCQIITTRYNWKYAIKTELSE